MHCPIHRGRAVDEARLDALRRDERRRQQHKDDQLRGQSHGRPPHSTRIPTRRVRGGTRRRAAMKYDVGSASIWFPTVALTLVSALEPRALNKSNASTANVVDRHST